MYCKTIFRCIICFFLLLSFGVSLHARLSRGRREAVLPVPKDVIGIFSCSTCPPAIAALLAVENFNAEHTSSDSIEVFTYKNLLISTAENLTDVEISHSVQNSILVSGDPLICERLSEIVSSTNSYLICYGPPTPTTLQTLKSTSNLYLSQQNPDAFVPCLFKLLMLLKLQLRDGTAVMTASESESEEEKESSSPFTVSILLDRTHPSSLVEKALFNNLSSRKIKVNLSWLEDNGRFPPNLHETFTKSGLVVVIAALWDFEARCLLCSLWRRRRCGQNLSLILLGEGGELPSKQWLNNTTEMEYYSEFASSIGEPYVCNLDELIAAAEGHFLLEFPAWETPDERDTIIIRRQLDQKLIEGGRPSRSYYNEAPLAYDSVWAMLQAITRSNSVPNGNSHHHHQPPPSSSNSTNFAEMVAEELTQSFTGLSGEISFNRNKMRRRNKAVIFVRRFEDGQYVEIGKHFNGNSSFPMNNSWLGREDSWTSNGTHPECNSNRPTSPSPSYDDSESKKDDVGGGGGCKVTGRLLTSLGFLFLTLFAVLIGVISVMKWLKRAKISQLRLHNETFI